MFKIYMSCSSQSYSIEADDLTEPKRGNSQSDAQTKNKILQSIEWSSLLGDKYFIF